MTESGRSGIEELVRGGQLYPQEELLRVKTNNENLTIGIPNEISLQEKRISLTPGAVKLLVKNGHKVLLESTAGESSKFSDFQYSEAGATITPDTKEVFQSDIILKVEPPTMQELEYIKPGKTLISALQIGNLTKEYIQAVNSKKITAIAYEMLEDKVGGMPLVRAMSEIAGSTVMFIAAEYLSSINNGRGVILGGITGVPPTKVVILGAGTVAEYAARTALGLGADIQVFDNHLYKLRRLRHALGHQVFTSTLDTLTLKESLKSADVVIGAIRQEKGKPIFMVSEEMVMQMKPGSVIIDVSIDQGGCFETSQLTTHDNPSFTKHGVIHFCVPNIASRVAGSASTVLSNIFTPIILSIGEAGGVGEMIFRYKWFMKGVYAYKGSLTNMMIANQFGLKYKDLGLLVAARF